MRRFLDLIVPCVRLGLLLKPYTFAGSVGGWINPVEVDEDFDILYEILDGGIKNEHISDTACIDMSKIDWGTCDPCNHGSRHCFGAEDPLPAGCIDWSQIDPGSVPPAASDDGQISKPAYDSGWQGMIAGQVLPLTHSLGLTDPDTDALVMVIWKYTAGTTVNGWPGTFTAGAPTGFRCGGDSWDWHHSSGVAWRNLTSTGIELVRGWEHGDAGSARVFIWRLV